MGVKFVRYKRDSAGIAAFLHSPELRAAVTEGCKDVVDEAKPESKTLADSYAIAPAGNVIIGDFSRLTMRVLNLHPAAAAIEFGAGRGRPGSSGDRRQGGYSYPQRILARAGDKIGDDIPGGPG